MAKARISWLWFGPEPCLDNIAFGYPYIPNNTGSSNEQLAFSSESLGVVGQWLFKMALK